MVVVFLDVFFTGDGKFDGKSVDFSDKVFLHVCTMYVRTYVRMNVCMYVRTYVHTYMPVHNKHSSSTARVCQVLCLAGIGTRGMPLNMHVCSQYTF